MNYKASNFEKLKKTGLLDTLQGNVDGHWTQTQNIQDFFKVYIGKDNAGLFKLCFAFKDDNEIFMHVFYLDIDHSSETIDVTSKHLSKITNNKDMATFTPLNKIDMQQNAEVNNKILNTYLSQLV